MSKRFGSLTLACALLCTPWGKAESQQHDSAAARAIATSALRDYYTVVQRTRYVGTRLGLHTPAIGAAAEKLWIRLDSAVRLNPSDHELVGVEAYHAMGGPDPAKGVQVANTHCITDDWWCNALKGFAYHNVSDFVASERHYDRALAQMPIERRCLWEDISHVMNDRAFAVEYRRVECADRGELNARIWWLSDPMWMVPANDRRTEHYSRWMMAELARVQLEMLRWRRFRTDEVNDPVGAILRFGALSWYRSFYIGCGAHKLELLNCSGSLRRDGDRFVVRREAGMSPYAFSVFDVQLGPVTHGLPYCVGGICDQYAVRYNADMPAPPESRTQTTVSFGEGFTSDVGRVHVLGDAQVAFLLRADSAAVLTSYSPREGGFRWTLDPVSGCCSRARPQFRAFPPISMAVAVAISSAPGDSISVVAGESRTTDPVRLALYTRHDSALVSLEAHSNQRMEYPVAVRHRFAIFRPDLGVTGRLRSSDLVLYDATTDQLPSSASEVHPLMLPRSTVDRSEPVGIYWEIYGVEAGEVVEFELSVTPRDPSSGVFRSLAQAAGLASRPGTVLTNWKSPEITSAQIGPHTETPHSLRVDLRHLRPGEYELGLTAQVAGDSAVSVAKLIRVR